MLRYIYIYHIALLDFHRVYLVEMESGYRLRCLAALRPYATSIPCAVWPVRSSVHGAVDLGSQLFPLKSPFNMFKLSNYVSIWVPFGSWVLGFRFIQVVSRCLILVTPGVFCNMQNHFNHSMDPRIARSQHRSHLLPAVPGFVGSWEKEVLNTGFFWMFGPTCIGWMVPMFSHVLAAARLRVSRADDLHRCNMM